MSHDPLVIEDTMTGFPIAHMAYLSFPGGAPVLNLVEPDGRTTRRQLTPSQLAMLVVEAMPHVVRV